MESRCGWSGTGGRRGPDRVSVPCHEKWRPEPKISTNFQNCVHIGGLSFACLVYRGGSHGLRGQHVGVRRPSISEPLRGWCVLGLPSCDGRPSMQPFPGDPQRSGYCRHRLHKSINQHGLCALPCLAEGLVQNRVTCVAGSGAPFRRALAELVLQEDAGDHGHKHQGGQKPLVIEDKGFELLF